MVRCDRVCAGSIGCKQGLVSVDVDASRETLGRFGDEFQRFRAKQVGTMVASGSKAEIQIIFDIARGQRQQIEAMRNSFF